MRKYDYNIVKEIFKKEGYYLLSEKYNNPREKLEIKDKYNYRYSVTLDQFLKGNKMRTFGKNNPFTIDNIKILLRINSINYELLSNEFKGTHNKLKFRCNKGHLFEIAWSDFQRGQRCPKCKGIKNAERCKLNYEDIKDYIESKGYSLLTKHYKNVQQKLLFKCSKNHIFEMNYNHFQRGQRCPYCSGSSGELEIQNYLEKYNYKYEREYTFDDLIYKNKLRFDFAIFDEKKLICLIEFDGIQHFKPKNFGSVSLKEAVEQLNLTKLRDKIKNDYCKKNKINLIRIHYTQINEIEDILNKTIPR